MASEALRMSVGCAIKNPTLPTSPSFKSYISVRNSRARIAICYSKLSSLLLKIKLGYQILRKSCYSSYLQ